MRALLCGVLSGQLDQASSTKQPAYHALAMPEARATQPVDNWYILIMYVHGQLLGMRRGQLPGPFSGLHLNTPDNKLPHRSFGYCPTAPWTRDPHQTDERNNFFKGEVM